VDINKQKVVLSCFELFDILSGTIDKNREEISIEWVGLYSDWSHKKIEERN